MKDSPERICQKIYKETKSFYTQLDSEGNKLGFKILYGPPLFKPPILFIGYQPGGDAESYTQELNNGAHERWPEICEYATQDWSLAAKLKTMFGPEYLTQCVGLNTIFIRAPDMKTYQNLFKSNIRNRIENFCLPRVEQIINAIQPQRIVSIGFASLRLFGNSIPDFKNTKGRVLTEIGQIAGKNAIATLHLSGARISTIDRSDIRNRILDFNHT